MFRQNGNRQHEGNAVSDRKRDASVATRSDGVYGMVARRRVDKSAVGEKLNRLVRLEGEVAIGAVGYCLVAVKRIVEMIQRR